MRKPGGGRVSCGYDKGLDRAYWDDTLAAFVGREADPWRVFCDGLHVRLLERWLGETTGRVLKTDLFDESAGVGLTPWLAAGGAEVHGLDISGVVAAQAARRVGHANYVSADVRRLPYADACFDGIVSNSTLDHFADWADVEAAMAELRRVLKPGGWMLISFDNLANPIVALRWALPFSWLHHVGLVPYFVGETVTPWGLRRLLRSHGFKVEREGTLMHVPRVLAIPLARRLGRRAPAAFGAFEWLERLPTRVVTGHFAVALAVKADGLR